MSFYVFCCVICLMCVKIASRLDSFHNVKSVDETVDYPISYHILNLAESKFRNRNGSLRFGAIKDVIARYHMDSSLLNYFDNEKFYEDNDRLSVFGLFKNHLILMKNDEANLKAKFSEKSTNNNDNNNDVIVNLQYAKEVFLTSKLFRGKLTKEALNKIIEQCKVENDNISYKEMIEIITKGFVDEELYSIWILKPTNDTLTTPTQ